MSTWALKVDSFLVHIYSFFITNDQIVFLVVVP